MIVCVNESYYSFVITDVLVNFGSCHICLFELRFDKWASLYSVLKLWLPQGDSA